MHIALDGLIYSRQAHGGITRLFEQVLPRVCELDAAVAFEIWTRRYLKGALPSHARIGRRVVPSLSGGPLSRNRFVQEADEALFRLAARGSRDALWHFTYMYLGWPSRWRGPKVITLYDLLFELNPAAYQGYIRLFLKHRKRSILESDRIICISESTRDDLLRTYNVDPARVRVIPLACGDAFQPVEEPRLPPLVPPEKPFLLYVGGRYRHKGFTTFMDAFAGWRPAKEFSVVVVSGEPVKPSESGQLAALGIADRVVFAGAVDDGALCALYNRAAALVYPSLHEGFGIPLLEAMACGCPIAATRIASTVEVATDIPFYADPHHAASLRDALDAAVNGRDDADRIDRGFRRVRDFSWDRTAQQTLDVYRELAG